MSEKIPLYKPLYTLKPISKNIWIADWDVVKMWFFLFDFRMTFLWNKKLARESFEKIIAWKPEKVILAHWRCYLENAEKELKRAFSWLY